MLLAFASTPRRAHGIDSCLAARQGTKVQSADGEVGPGRQAAGRCLRGLWFLLGPLAPAVAIALMDTAWDLTRHPQLESFRWCVGAPAIG